jgi:hypothetical protein
MLQAILSVLRKLYSWYENRWCQNVESRNMNLYEVFKKWAKSSGWITTGHFTQVDCIRNEEWLTPLGGLVNVSYNSSTNIITLNH